MRHRRRRQKKRLTVVTILALGVLLMCVLQMLTLFISTLGRTDHKQLRPVQNNHDNLELSHAKCIEFQSIKQHMRGQKRPLYCPLSAERWGCRNTEQATQEWLQKNSANQPDRSVRWEDVVLMMLIVGGNDSKQNRLLRAHFDTWMRHDGQGLDVVLITDDDDPRQSHEIVPHREILPTIHVYRSSAKKEGKHARFKVKDGLQRLYRMFNTKIFFLKMDPDAVLMPTNLLGFLRELKEALPPRKPAYFGLAMCHDENALTCHAGGGLYGMNRRALESVVQFFQSNNEFELNQNQTSLLIHEDYMVAHALKKATLMPVINCGGFYTEPPWKYASQHRRKQRVWVTWPLTNHPICFHHVRDPDIHRLFECYFYDENGHPRDHLPWQAMFSKRNICSTDIFSQTD